MGAEKRVSCGPSIHPHPFVPCSANIFAFPIAARTIDLIAQPVNVRTQVVVLFTVQLVLFTAQLHFFEEVLHVGVLFVGLGQVLQ